MASGDSLKQKMREFTEGKTGSLHVSSADLAAESAAPTDSGYAATKGTVKAEVPEAAKKDVFAKAGETASVHRAISPSFIADTVDITDEDREAFLSALVTGGRYERDFSLFGGKLRGTFRCRSVGESDGIIAWLGHCVNTKKVDAKIEYMSTMRNAVLAAQVKSLRGLINEDFPELAAPYAPTRSADGTTLEDPAWVGACEAWSRRPEALVSALHNELQLFEARYWTMVSSAASENFWHPAASI